MITDRRLDALRVAATLNHLHPSLLTRLRAEGRTVVEVESGAGPGSQPRTAPSGAAVVRLTPCHFRAATAKAWSERRAGRRLQLVGLDAEPTVELSGDGADRVWPSGIARIVTPELVTYVFGTFLGPDRCRVHARELLEGAPAPDGLLDLVLRRDSDTEVTAVSAEVDPAAALGAEAEVLELFESLLARFVAVELLDDVRAEGVRG